jgi:phosphoglycolate phosphatase
MKLVVFDLDGTLVDSAEDIARSVNELLSDLGRPTLTHERIVGYIGNGVHKLLERSLGGARAEEVDAAVAPYLSIYRRRLLEHTRPYPGVVEALDALKRGASLAVLTNKPIFESLAILEGLNLRGYFRVVYGGDSFARKKPDPIGVLHLLGETGSPREETLLVGDSAVDVETARRASVRSCLVTYGPGGDGGASPDLRVDDLRELLPLFAGGDLET